MMRRLGIGLVGTMAVLLATACNKQAAHATPGYSAVVTAQDINGKTIGAATDKRATIVVFFATWCGPCRKELKMLSKLRDELPAVRVVGINAYEEWSNLSNQRKLRDFLKENAPWLQVVRADKGLFKAFGGVPKIPSMFIFNSKGTLVKEFRRSRRPPPSRIEVDRVLSSIGPAA